jgi:hypothetical protein
MSKALHVAWTVPRSEDLELRDFALGVLEIAKENLQRDGELVPTAFAITRNQIQCYSISFAGHDEKSQAYSELIEAARNIGAVALITCNDALWSNDAGPEYVEGYYPGKLAVEGAKECIMLTVSGSAIETWALEVPYERIGDTIKFGDACEEAAGEVGFLEGWASGKSKIH